MATAIETGVRSGKFKIYERIFARISHLFSRPRSAVDHPLPDLSA
jgi:hypothetical protein